MTSSLFESKPRNINSSRNINNPARAHVSKSASIASSSEPSTPSSSSSSSSSADQAQLCTRKKRARSVRSGSLATPSPSFLLLLLASITCSHVTTTLVIAFQTKTSTTTTTRTRTQKFRPMNLIHLGNSARLTRSLSTAITSSTSGPLRPRVGTVPCILGGQSFPLFLFAQPPKKSSRENCHYCFESRLFSSSANGEEVSIMSNQHIHDKNKQQEHASSLSDQLATWLVQGQSSSKIMTTTTTTTSSSSPSPIGKIINNNASTQIPMRACLAIAGGGSKAASSIASVPGASSVLLESIVPYDRRSFAEFVTTYGILGGGGYGNGLHGGIEEESGGEGGVINGNAFDEWLAELESMGTKRLDKSFSVVSSEDDDKATNSKKEFHFCSTEAAILLSRSALHRSMQLSPSFRDKSLHCIGVGCTSSLVGKLPAKGVELTAKEQRMSARKSRAFIACTTLKDGTCAWEVELSCDVNDLKEKVNGDAVCGRRSRSQEEAIVSNLILLSMLQHREGLDMKHDNIMKTMLDQILDREGDSITVRYFGKTERHGSSDENSPSQSPAVGAQQIINGYANVVAVLPVQLNTTGESSGEQQPTRQMKSLYSDNRIPFPNDVLIVPGSFNPPHHGHVALANAAVAALQRLRQNDDNKNTKSYSRYSSMSSFSSTSSSSILDSIWNSVQKHSIQNDPAVLFEISVTNADKPPLDPSEVERRVNLFLSLPPSEMPTDWGVTLTNAPLFSQKTSILDGVIRGESSSGSSAHRKMTFVLGTDTFVRIINPKYYGNSQESMVAALVEMKERGVHFIVGGRLEQGTDDKEPKFVSGEDELVSLPQHVQEMFTILTEEDFRVDVSSTELRRKMAAESKA